MQELAQQLIEQGYVVVPDVIPPELCERVIKAIGAYLDLEVDDTSSWYRREQSGHGIVPLHHDQALWDVRQHPRLHEVFSALYGDAALWVSMDRVSYKPPASTQTQSWRRERVHWDCDPWKFTALSLQGLVYLNDTTHNQGAFACVPAIYQNLSSHLTEHQGDDNRRHPQIADAELTQVEGAAGSLVVFHRLMPHTSVLNRTDQHRFVQYVTMAPVTTPVEREQRILEWQNKMPPAWAINQKIADQQIPEPGPPATLTALGRRLVGLDEWS